MIAQLLRDLLDRDGRERRGVSLCSLERCNLRQQTLDQVTDGHSGRNSVRVDDDVGRDSLGRERHVLLTVRDSDCSLLTVTRGKLVSNLRHSSRSDSNLDKLGTVGVGGDEDLVDNTLLRCERGEKARVSLVACTAKTKRQEEYALDLRGVETSRLVWLSSL